MSIAFDEVRFPASDFARRSGGPERRTEIVTLALGPRGAQYAAGRIRGGATMPASGSGTLDEIHDVVRFFEERRGRLHGFRWKDHADFKSCAPQGR